MRLLICFLLSLTANAAVNTPNMSLIQPTIGVDTGLTWEQSLNANASIIDSHNHTPGNGVQIPPSGININSNLTFQGNQAINLQATVYSPQASLSTLYAIYSIGNDLYFNDGAGNPVRITSGGAVAVTSSGISDGSGNSASFSAATLVVQNTSTQPRNIQVASVLLGNATASSNYLTLNPPSAMGSNISETLPTIPGSLSIMQMNSSGNMSASLQADGSTIVNSGSQLMVPNGGITSAQIALNTVGVDQIRVAARQLASTYYALPGTSTFTTPTNSSTSTVYKVTVVGGGGSGSKNTNCGGAGGGGGAAIKYLSGLTANTGYTAVIGSAGNQSYFINTSTVAANGGSAGLNQGTGGSAGQGGNGTNGDILLSGNSGSGGFASGNNFPCGAGGGSIFGGGGVGESVNAVSASNGLSCGGGGGASASLSAGTGHAGCILIEWVL